MAEEPSFGAFLAGKTDEAPGATGEIQVSGLQTRQGQARLLEDLARALLAGVESGDTPPVQASGPIVSAVSKLSEIYSQKEGGLGDLRRMSEAELLAIFREKQAVLRRMGVIVSFTGVDGPPAAETAVHYAGPLGGDPPPERKRRGRPSNLYKYGTLKERFKKLINEKGCVYVTQLSKPWHVRRSHANRLLQDLENEGFGKIINADSVRKAQFIRTGHLIGDPVLIEKLKREVLGNAASREAPPSPG